MHPSSGKKKGLQESKMKPGEVQIGAVHRNVASYTNLARVLRDRELEARLGLELHPLPSPLVEDLLRRLSSAWDALAVKSSGQSSDAGTSSGKSASAMPEIRKAQWMQEVQEESLRGVLGAPLTDQQRRTIDEQLLTPYSQAIELDEKPRLLIPVRECGERMVDLVEALSRDGVPHSLSETTFHAACGPYAGKPRIFWCRAGVADRFSQFARGCLGAEVVPHLEDVFRPREVQAGLYQRRYRLIRDEHPHWSKEQVRDETNAKTAPTPFRAAHMGGAAIDVTLRDLGGKPLPLGNAYPVGGCATVLAFPYVTAPEWFTRVLFEGLATLAGLVPYPGEDWHVSFGDSLAALLTGAPKIQYGAIEGFDSSTGEVFPYPAERMHEEFPLL